MRRTTCPSDLWSASVSRNFNDSAGPASLVVGISAAPDGAEFTAQLAMAGLWPAFAVTLSLYDQVDPEFYELS
eukprot:m.166051 g.166051  ORF g.166051 m.166051 type:complete len:73 (+) comp12638_c0_seq1:2984-3202(+)